MSDKAISKALYDRAAEELQKRNDGIDNCVRDLQRKGLIRNDEQNAPIWAEKLRHSYAKMPETIYPDLPVANGELLPVDGSVNPATLEYEWYMIDSGAMWDWIDEDGHVAPTAFVKARRFTGKHAPFAGGYKHTLDELEKAAYAKVPLTTIKQAAVKKGHDEFVQWVWLFGDASHEVYGLCTHPNLPVSLAAAGASTSRLPVNKTNDEILADFATLIDAIPQQSVEAHHCAEVRMSYDLGRLLKRRRISGTANGMVTLWDVLVDQYKGDETGQGKVTFRFLNECDADRRANKNADGTDTSGIAGDFILALPAQNVDELAFIRCRAPEQLAPQQEDMAIKILVRADIGGCRMVRPLACHMMLFGLT